MKDLKPNIHCSGCGAPWFKTPKDTGTNTQSDKHYYCHDCTDFLSRGVRSAKMLNHVWFSKLPIAVEQLRTKRKLQGKKDLSLSDLEKIGLLRCNRNCSCLPPESPFNGDPHKMTSQEWKEIGKMRLAHHKQTCACDKRTATLLRFLIREARV